MMTPPGSSGQFQTYGHKDGPASLSELPKKTKGTVLGKGPMREHEG